MGGVGGSCVIPGMENGTGAGAPAEAGAAAAAACEPNPGGMAD